MNFDVLDITCVTQEGNRIADNWTDLHWTGRAVTIDLSKGTGRRFQSCAGTFQPDRRDQWENGEIGRRLFAVARKVDQDPSDG